jgi:hypothetical protein
MTADYPMNHKLIISLNKDTDPTQDTTTPNTHAKPIMQPLLPHQAEPLLQITTEHLAEIMLTILGNMTEEISLVEVEDLQGVAEHLILPKEDPTIAPQPPPEITMTDLHPLNQEGSIQISNVSFAIRTIMSWIVPMPQ